MLFSAINMTLWISVVLILGSCTEHIIEPNLDHYGAYENAELEITIEGEPDSCFLQLENYQELNGWINFDTTLLLQDGHVRFRKKLTLERPSILLLKINDKEKEVFLIPDSNNDIQVQIDSSDIKITFEDKDLQNINSYYQQKEAIGGEMSMRSLRNGVMSLPSFTEVLDSLDSVRSELNQILIEMEESLNLPSWFVRFEEKNIEYICLTMKANAHRVRRVLFGLNDTLPGDFSIHNLGFDLNDELALTTDDYLSSLPNLIQIDTDAFDINELDPVRLVNLFYQNSKLLKNDRIRDVLQSHLFYNMLRTSHHFPPLIAKVKGSISDDMQPYVERIEKKYTQFNGLEAPAIHLVDGNDNLVSLRDFKGTLVLLDFWFVGCRFCKIENPFMKTLIEEFQDKNFKVLQICMKSDRKAWEELRYDFVGIPLYSNEHWDKKLEYSYKISGYPRYVLIDGNGVVLEGWCERPSDPALRQRILDYFDSKEDG